MPAKLRLADYPDPEEDADWHGHFERRYERSPEGWSQRRPWIDRVASTFHDRWVETPQGWVPRQTTRGLPPR